MRSGELAERLGISDSSIRNWTDLYGEFLSPRGAGVQPGATREFNDDDGLVLATVANLRAQNVAHDEIMETLRGGWRVEDVPELPEPEVEEARREIRLVPVSDVERWKDRAQFALAELNEVRERERQALDRIADLSREVGQLEGRGELLSRLESETEELKDEVKRLREELERERNRKRGPFGLW